MANYDVTTAAAKFQFDANAITFNSCAQVDANHFINFWARATSGIVETFAINTSTWAITTAASILTFDTQFGQCNSCYKVDTNHFINFWDGGVSTFFDYVQIFTVNTSTWAVTTAAASLEFDTAALSGNLGFNSCAQVDANHFINFWGSGAGVVGKVEVFSVNTTTWVITTDAASLTFDTTGTGKQSCCQIDTNHFINFWRGATGTNGLVQTFTVNTTTWAVTTAAARLQFETSGGNTSSCFKVDANHFINFWEDSSSLGEAQIFTVNTSTWAITTAAARLQFDAFFNQYNSCYQVDANHFINFWASSSNHDFVEVFTVNTSTWVITTSAASLQFDTQRGFYNSCFKVDTSHFINFWEGLSNVGQTQIFSVALPAVASSYDTLFFGTNF
jgi:hypothetical protein